MADEILPETKTCTKCGKAKPRTAEFFPRRKKRSRDGLASWCKTCHLANSQKWRTRPEVKEADRLRTQEYRKTPRYRELAKARHRKRLLDPTEREAKRIRERVRYAKKKEAGTHSRPRRRDAEGRQRELARKREWALNNKDKVRECQRRPARAADIGKSS